MSTDGTAGLSEKEHNAITEKETRWQDLPPHKDEDQVDLDVKRSFVYYPQGKTSVTMLFDLKLTPKRPV